MNKYDESTLDQLRWWAEEARGAHANRDDWIRAAREEGHSLRAIAEAAEMSVEAVRRISQKNGT